MIQRGSFSPYAGLRQCTRRRSSALLSLDCAVMTRPTGRWKVEPMVMEKAPSGDRKSSGGCRDRLLS